MFPLIQNSLRKREHCLTPAERGELKASTCLPLVRLGPSWRCCCSFPIGLRARSRELIGRGWEGDSRSHGFPLTPSEDAPLRKRWVPSVLGKGGHPRFRHSWLCVERREIPSRWEKSLDFYLVFSESGLAGVNRVLGSLDEVGPRSPRSAFVGDGRSGLHFPDWLARQQLTVIICLSGFLVSLARGMGCVFLSVPSLISVMISS